MTTGDAAEICHPYATGDARRQRKMIRRATMGTETALDVIAGPYRQCDHFERRYSPAEAMLICAEMQEDCNQRNQEGL
jgi:hypothetical protein